MMITLYELSWTDTQPKNLDYFNKQEIQVLNKLSNKKRYYQFLWCRYYLKKILATHLSKPVSSIDIHNTEQGKPFIKAPIYFSLTHKEQQAYICVSEQPCGIDLEHITDTNYEKLAKKMLSPSEYHLYQDSTNKEETFLRYWCIKESITKLDGQPLLQTYKQLQCVQLSHDLFIYKNQKNNRLYYGHLLYNQSQIISVVSLSKSTLLRGEFSC
jgi:phosphopantetheine--protein transferase-like protein